MQHDDLVRLLHIAEALRAAVGFVHGRRREDIDDDVMLRYALGARAIQVRAQAGGELIPVPKEVLDQPSSRQRQGPRVWPGLRRRLDRLDPSYKS